MHAFPDFVFRDVGIAGWHFHTLQNPIDILPVHVVFPAQRNNYSIHRWGGHDSVLALHVPLVSHIDS